MLEKLIKFTLEKPILNHLFLFFLIVMATFSYQRIPKELFPISELDIILVQGSYVGASANILDKMAVKTIEDDLKNLNEIETITSIIGNGFFKIKAELKDGQDIDDTVDDIKDIVSNIKRDLPSDMNEPTVKSVKKSFPLVTVAVASNRNRNELLSIADDLKSRLSSIKDLNGITIWGDSDEELVFFINDKKIDALGLDKLQIINSISSLSAIFPIGSIKQNGEHLFLSTINGEKNIEKIQNTILKVGDKKVYIKDIADVSFQLSDATQLSHYNGIPNISINVQKGERGNAIALVKEIKEILKDYEKKYEGVKFNTYTDTSIWIKNRLNTVVSNILFGLILVFLAMYIFINGRIAIVVGLGIPTSFMIGLIASDMMGYSLNMLSLLGALIALGMLVDEAIVVAENIHRHFEMGKDPVTATIDGASEMLPAVLTATATTIFAFLPLLMMTGALGLFIKILPVMITILLLSSLMEAFFFLPLHSKELFKVGKKDEKINIIWIKLNKTYQNILIPILNKKWFILPIFVTIVIVSTILMIKNSKFQLMPTFDASQIYVNGKVDVNNQLEDTEKIITKLENHILNVVSDKNVKSVTSIVGFKLDSKNRAETGDYYFQIFINLHERAPENFYNEYINPYFSPNYTPDNLVRTDTAHIISQRVQEAIKPINNKDYFDELTVIVPQAGLVKSDIEISFIGKNLANNIKNLEKEMIKIDGVSNISNDLFEGTKELKFRVNSYGKSLGFDEINIFTALKPFFLKGEHSKMFNENGLVRVKLQSIHKDNIDTLNNFYIKIPQSNQNVRLQDVVDFIYQSAYTKIIKEDGMRITSIFASLDKKVITSSEFLEKIESNLNQLKDKGIKVIIKGEQKENEQVKNDMTKAGILSILLIFIALVWMFNSLVKPFIILSVIPLSVLGVLVGHFLMDLNMTMPSVIGIVGLTGVVVNDGLIMLDFIKGNKTITEVVIKATMRIRPIMLTSITTLLGLSTLIFFATGQALILQPMAVTLGFGLAWATILNLFYIPLLYSIIYKVKNDDKLKEVEKI